MIRAVLIADGGEAAIRISRACAALGVRSVAVFAADDPASLHIRRADASHALPGSGQAAYLDTAAIVAAAQQAGCDAVHPGCGPLSEDAGVAMACEAAGLIFVGPSPDLLALFADTPQARQLAAECSVPTPQGSGETCAEDLVGRHVEIQIVGDGQGGITQVGERDCTVQHHHRNLIEVAPSPGLQPMVRARMAQAAVAMARRVKLRGLCTFAFRLSAKEGARFVFTGANPRLQAQHTVTEEVYGLDLVAAQLRLAGGATLGELGLSQSAIAAPRGCAIQLRVTMGSIQPDGDVRRASGRIAAYEPPSGPGLRVDGCGYGGYVATGAFDGLLAKVIVRAGTYAEAIARADRALQEFRVEGVPTNIGVLREILRHPDFTANRVTTRWLDASGPALLAEMEPGLEPGVPLPEPGRGAEPGFSAVAPISPGTVLVSVPIRAALLTLKVAVGDDVRRGQQLAVLEAMTLQHVVTSPIAGVVFSLPTNIGDILQPGEAVALISPEPTQAPPEPETHAMICDSLRDFLAALRAQGQLLTIAEQVAPEPDLGAAGRAITEMGGMGPALLFTNILGFTGAQVALNVHGSWPNHALMLGMDKSATCKAQFLESVRRYRSFPGGVERRESAPWQECVINRPEDINLLELLPLFRIDRHDGGCLIDKAVVVSREPDRPDDRGRQTAGIYRLQVKGARWLGILPAPFHAIAVHLQQAEERSEGLKIAIAIGNDPIITCVAARPVLDDPSGYAMAGALRGTPYPVVPSAYSGLDVPWGSEIVLEGHILGRQRETEGPFAECTGLHSGGRLMPVVEITKVSHRRNPILESLYPGMPWSQQDDLLAIHTSAPIFVQLKEQFPEVEAVNAACTHGMVVIVSTRCRRAGFAKNIGLRVLTTPHGLGHAKIVIVVDETIDPFDLKQVMWALSTTFHPAHDLIIVPGVSVEPLDPGASAPGITHKMILDATTPVPPDVRGKCDTPLDRPAGTDAWREKLMEMLRG